MGWEKGGRYYTRSRKVGGGVEREYIGGGRIGELAEQMDRADRAEREQRAKELKAQREAMKAADEEVDRLCEVTDLLARAALLAAGYRQHHRGEWRRKRGERNDSQ